jgi:glycosyltransferase involved in cell wall biosynthesis
VAAYVVELWNPLISFGFEGVAMSPRFWPRKARHREPFCVLVIAKNEGMVIEEWIDHYLWQGASHIYLIDNGSTDDTHERARPWIEKGVVIYEHRPEPHRQRFHYWDVILKHRIRQKYEWLLVADADEFWFCRDGRPLVEWIGRLSQDDSFDLVYVRPIFFGSSGHRRQPASVRTSFTWRYATFHDYRITRYLVRPDKLWSRRSLGVHRIKGIKSTRVMALEDIFQVNHYTIMSLEYYTNIKLTRGDAFYETNARSLDIFHGIDASCTVEDRLLHDLVEACAKTSVSER